MLDTNMILPHSGNLQ